MMKLERPSDGSAFLHDFQGARLSRHLFGQAGCKKRGGRPRFRAKKAAGVKTRGALKLWMPCRTQKLIGLGHSQSRFVGSQVGLRWIDQRATSRL